jgi:small conductance mechanosensitive channel
MDLIDLARVKALLLNHVTYAVLSLLIGVVVSRLASRWLRIALDRSRVRDDVLLKDFFLRALSFSILGLAVIAALSSLGFEVGSFLAGLGITGLIIGFGLRDTLANFAAGLLLLIYRPFRAGELIEVEGSQGVVEELSIVNMEMTTSDGVRVIMPNSKVWGAKIINFSKSKQRRLELSVNIPAAHVERAIPAIQSTLEQDLRVLKEPAPVVKASSIVRGTAQLTAWVWTKPEDLPSLSGDAYQKVLSVLTRSEIPVR